MSKPWTAEDVRVEFNKFRDEIGNSAEVSVSINTQRYNAKGPACHVLIYPRGYTAGGLDETISLNAPTFEELLDIARTKWGEMNEQFALRTVRKMALEIIKITADQGACSDASLRQASFTPDELAKYGASACADANEIAANGPFEIATLAGANDQGQAA